MRVIEEYFRFVIDNEECAISLKKIRHQLIAIEQKLVPEKLLSSRNSEDDCFSDHNRPEEIKRDGFRSLLTANFKRSQESARVIEEYAKLTKTPEVSESAKIIRFSLYTLERNLTIGTGNGET